jgi:hypothetical protein
MAIGVTLTYEQQVFYIAEAIDGDFSSVRSIAVASAAYALSLAHSKGVAEVTADIKASMTAQGKSK